MRDLIFADCPPDATLGPEFAPWPPRRSVAQPGALVRAWRATLDVVREAADAYRANRRARATFRALSELDARTLRDLGVDRSEILSVSIGLAEQGDRTPAHLREHRVASALRTSALQP